MITQARLKLLFDYDPSTGHLVRRIAIANTHVGQIAGWRTKLGYYAICVDRRKYLVHRLAWLFMTGEVPVGEIDHVNGDGLDNRWANLREADRAENSWNARRHKRSSSGFKGVYLHKLTGRWRSCIMRHGRRIHLGMFDDPKAAHQAYCSAANKLFGEFARKA